VVPPPDVAPPADVFPPAAVVPPADVFPPAAVVPPADVVPPAEVFPPAEVVPAAAPPDPGVSSTLLWGVGAQARNPATTDIVIVGTAPNRILNSWIRQW
jgi:hypothetical protein